MEKPLNKNEDPEVSGLQTLIGFRPLKNSALSFYCIFKKKKPFKGILDTGADVSVISQKHWPDEWP